MAVQATGPQQRQQMPWNPQKQDVDEDNVVAVDEDVKLAEPLHVVQQAIIYRMRAHTQT